MKKSILVIMVACCLFTLSGCKNRSEMQLLQPSHAAELKPMQQSYRGVIPCADCQGIEVSLFFEKDSSWVMNQRYQGRDVVLASYGTWARTADKLVLRKNDGKKSYFRSKRDGLEMLDQQGNPLSSQFYYFLNPVNGTLPVTPMTMKGKYKYVGNQAMFQDCATGITFPVVSNIVVEQGFIKATEHTKNSQPVLLVVEAHFTLQMPAGGGERQKMLVVDKDAQFNPGKDCTD